MDSLKKVYLVWRGEYSDANVVAVMSDREKADELATCYRTGNVEEHVLDHTPKVPLGLQVWSVSMYADGSPVDEWRSRSGAYQDDPDDDTPVDWTAYAHTDWVRSPGSTERETTGAVWFRGYARDKEHAIKIANDMRAQIIARNRWPKKGERVDGDVDLNR